MNSAKTLGVTTLLAGIAMAALGGCTYVNGDTDVSDDKDANGDTDVNGDTEPSQDGVAQGVTARKDRRLFPLEVGREWTFDVTALDARSPCSGIQKQWIPGSAAALTGAGKTYRFLPVCQRDEVILAQSGDRVTVYFIDENGEVVDKPFLLLEEPAEGVVWKWDPVSGPSFRWHALGTVRVPAGTFEDCWEKIEVRDDGQEGSSYVYCRGVGQVKRHDASDFVTGEGDAVLRSKNF